MRHFRTDYQERIQDSAKIIPADEPVFLIRGQDANAVATLRAYAHINQRDGGDPKLSEHVLAIATEMEKWPVKKVPDLYSTPAGGSPETEREAEEVGEK